MSLSSLIPTILSWLQEHRSFTWWLGIISLLTFITTLAIIPLILVRLPADYFTRENPPFKEKHPVGRRILLFGKNLLGLFFLIAGFMMLFLPGQGMLTILLAISLLNFPGKKRLEHRLIQWPKVLQTINKLRQKANRPPLDNPSKDSAH